MACEHSKADPILYVLKRENHFVFLMVYLDDILIFSNMQVELDEMVGKFSNQFEIRESKTIKLCPDTSIEDSDDMIKMHNGQMI